MKITLNKDSEKIELLKAMASRNKGDALVAQEAFAAFVGPIIAQVLDQAATSNLIYQGFSYNRGDNPSFPLDLLEGNTEGLLTVWSQTLPGGLATNHVSGMDEFRFTVDRLDSAVSCLKQHAENARLDVISAMIKRMAQEILVKSEFLNWSTILAALANSRTGPGGTVQLYAAGTADTFKLDDLNTLWVKVKRLRTSWAGGTPTSTPGRGLTHLIVSPEVEGDIRAFCYNPQNATAVPDTAESTALGLPDALRQQIYNNAGITELFGVKIIPLLEFGDNQAYNLLFDDYYTAAGGETAFNGVSDELVLGIDNSIPSFLKITEESNSSTVTVEPDDQWVRRSEKLGFYASKVEGRIGLDSKAVVGLKV